MKKLFMISIGGSIIGANIEVNDIQFIIADSIEDTYETLMRDWYGNSLHIDEYTIVEYVDDYKVELINHSQFSDYNIFFVAAGGSDKNHFGEVHDYGLLVTTSKKLAVTRGKKELLKNCFNKHIDNIETLQSLVKFVDIDYSYINIVPTVKGVKKNKRYSFYHLLK